MQLCLASWTVGMLIKGDARLTVFEEALGAVASVRTNVNIFDSCAVGGCGMRGHRCSEGV